MWFGHLCKFFPMTLSSCLLADREDYISVVSGLIIYHLLWFCMVLLLCHNSMFSLAVDTCRYNMRLNSVSRKVCKIYCVSSSSLHVRPQPVSWLLLHFATRYSFKLVVYYIIRIRKWYHTNDCRHYVKDVSLMWSTLKQVPPIPTHN